MATTPIQFEKLANRLYRNQLKIEIPLLCIALIAWILSLMTINGVRFFLNLSLIMLSLTYFFISFRTVENKTAYDDFFLKLIGWSLSVVVIAVLFKLLGFPGNQLLITNALVFICLSVLLSAVNLVFLRKSNIITKVDFIRIFIALVVVVLLKFLVNS